MVLTSCFLICNCDVMLQTASRAEIEKAPAIDAIMFVNLQGLSLLVRGPSLVLGIF
jgi:hypothetical protein